MESCGSPRFIGEGSSFEPAMWVGANLSPAVKRWSYSFFVVEGDAGAAMF